MNDTLLGVTSVTRSSSGGMRLYAGKDISERLGDAEKVAWFLDEDSGLVYVVPHTEVTLR